METWQIILLTVLTLINLILGISLIGIMFGASFGAPYVPSRKKIVNKMIDLANLKEDDKVFDLGCGDGRIVFAAENYTRNCIGIDISPPVILWAKIKRFFLKKKSQLKIGNFFHIKEVKEADVIFLFLFPQLMKKFYKEIYPHLKKGTRIISHAFIIDELQPKKALLRKKTGHASIYLFVK